MTWTRSSYCAGGNCVEVAFTRSTHCATNACIEVAIQPDHVMIRDSKHPDHIIAFGRDDWTAFLAGVKAGEFDG